VAGAALGDVGASDDTPSTRGFPHDVRALPRAGTDDLEGHGDSLSLGGRPET